MKGTAPSPRHSHSCVIHGTSLIFFGGACEGGSLDPSLYVLDICTHCPPHCLLSFSPPANSFFSLTTLKFDGDKRKLLRKEKQHKEDGDTLLWFIPPRCSSLEDSMMMVIPINSLFSISVTPPSASKVVSNPSQSQHRTMEMDIGGRKRRCSRKTSAQCISVWGWNVHLWWIFRKQSF